MDSSKSPPQVQLRPIDLAREHGLSAQAVRNYEDAGVLPEAERSPSGYRRYTGVHRQALATFLALRVGFGHQTATSILRSAHRGEIDRVLASVGQAHVDLDADRQTLTLVQASVRDLRPPATPHSAVHIGPMAHRLGLRPATLRAWERAGVLRPTRQRGTGYRVYGPNDVRDALLAHQLRRGGHPLSRLAAVLDQVRAAGGVAELNDLLADWNQRLLDRGRALLQGCAALDSYLNLLEASGR